MSKIENTYIEEAVEILKNGGIVIHPTETVYGIGCDPFNREACERVQRLKKREGTKPLLLLASSLSQVESLTGELPPAALKLAGVFWPGPLTMVIRPVNELPEHLYGESAGVAFRVTSHPLAASLAREFGCPVISTSANITGRKPVVTYEDAKRLFGESVDIILKNNFSNLLTLKPSTVVDITSKQIAVIREGSISSRRIREVI